MKLALWSLLVMGLYAAPAAAKDQGDVEGTGETEVAFLRNYDARIKSLEIIRSLSVTPGRGARSLLQNSVDFEGHSVHSRRFVASIVQSDKEEDASGPQGPLPRLIYTRVAGPPVDSGFRGRIRFLLEALVNPNSVVHSPHRIGVSNSRGRPPPSKPSPAASSDLARAELPHAP